jgi:hypothetical protein
MLIMLMRPEGLRPACTMYRTGQQDGTGMDSCTIAMLLTALQYTRSVVVLSAVTMGQRYHC